MGTFVSSILMMMHTEKYCLKWNEFEENIRNYFTALRSEQKLFDVTLATDDGHQIQAHKVILSSGSDFFSDIFSKFDKPDMFVYLKGIPRTDLENITNFLYNGETFVPQQELPIFLDNAQELKVKGLKNVEDSNSDETAHNVLDPEEKVHENIAIGESKALFGAKHNGYTEILDIETTITAFKEDSFNEKNLELDQQLEKLVEKSEGLWKCKICKKTSNNKSNMLVHAEIHVEGNIHSCNVCVKTFNTRDGLKTHVKDIHSKLYSCMVCGKADMNKKAVRHHKKKCHGTLEEQIFALEN